MTGSNETESKKTLSLGRGRLELKKTVETGQVRQSFSHGRSKNVTVEVKRKRVIGGGGGRGGKNQEVDLVEDQEDTASLSAEERRARVMALQGAIKAEEETRQRNLEAERRQREEEEREREAEEAEQRRKEEAEAEQRRVAEEEAKRQLEAEEAAKRERAEKKAAAKPAPARAQERQPEVEEQEAPRSRGAKRGEAKKPAPSSTRRQEPRRRAGKLTISQALEEGERQRSLASVRRAREREKQRAREALADRGSKVIREVVVPETITVQELANRMAERGADVIKSLMRMGVMATINHPLDADTAELVVEEFGHRIRRVSESDVELGLKGADDADDQLETRPPVVTIMGHVDHGKTSLLDALRETDVAGREAGGITQHIGAYQVTLKDGGRITFLDTPGHEAFTAMRARGANVTDLVVLVVAADDGIMAQTVEAIRHAQAAEVPIIVAVNKIDRPDADGNRVRQELLQHGLVVEEMGGDILAVDVSAKEKTNLDKLMEAILLQAELLELKANPERAAEGVVVEAKLDRGRGSVATLLVQRGTLHPGEIFVAGSEWGRVRALIDDHGNQTDAAGPSAPVEVLGLNGTPQAGDDFVVVESEARAREISDFRQRKIRDAQAAAGARGSLEQMLLSIKAGEKKELPVVIKADVQGSAEAIVASLEKLNTDEVGVRILHTAVGGINESDITLAQASNAMIVGFNVRANPQARDLARREGLELRYYSVIYNLIDDVKAMVSGMLAPELREKIIGNADIREVFSVSKAGKVAGCRVTEGFVKRGAKVRLLRDSVVIHEGSLKTLRRFKDDVQEVREGFECGMAFENYQDIQVGDVIECFEVEEVARSL